MSRADNVRDGLAGKIAKAIKDRYEKEFQNAADPNLVVINPVVTVNGEKVTISGVVRVRFYGYDHDITWLRAFDCDAKLLREGGPGGFCRQDPAGWVGLAPAPGWSRRRRKSSREGLLHVGVAVCLLRVAHRRPGARRDPVR